MRYPKMLMKSIGIGSLLVSSLTGHTQERKSCQFELLTQAHAHNDYEHNSPLNDAVHNGFTSVEVDVGKVDSQLVVAHVPALANTSSLIKKGRTLQKLYLDPLMDSVRKNNGHVYANSSKKFRLMIDLKTNGLETYLLLREVLKPYSPMLSHYKNGELVDGAVEIFMTGHKIPKEVLDAEEVRYVSIDGDNKDVDRKFSPSYMPMISMKWGKKFSWHGDGAMPKKQHERFLALVKKVHDNGQEIRFWGTPEKDKEKREAVWNVLYDAHVDKFNTDHLPEMREFFMKKEEIARQQELMKAVIASNTVPQ